MFGHAEKALGGEVISGQSEGYIIWQDQKISEAAGTGAFVAALSLRRRHRTHGSPD